MNKELTINEITDDQLLIDYFDNGDCDYPEDLEELMSKDSKKSELLQDFAITINPKLISAFNWEYISGEMILKALSLESDQDCRDEILAVLNTKEVNDNFINKFIDHHWIAGSESDIYQVIDSCSHAYLNIASIKKLLNTLILEIDANTSSKDDCMYGSNGIYYHWTYCLRWESINTLLNQKKLFSDNEFLGILKIFQQSVSNHFLMLKNEESLYLIEADLSYDEFPRTADELIDQWLDGLQELIDRNE